MTTVPRPTPFCLLIAALGGEGGSVLMNWVVAAARAAGFAVQATSVPGVAQRTGSTSYYIEMLPQPAGVAAAPVFALVPMPGRVDVVLASELVEAGRMLERGFVAPDRTTMIASVNRVITTGEKVHGGDGRHDPARVEAGIAALAHRSILLDLDAIARREGTLVSATLYGALIESGVLPFPASDAVRVVSDERSRRGVDAARAAVRALAEPFPAAVSPVQKPAAPDAQLQTALADIVALGRSRLAEYQDEAYATLYATRVDRLAGSAPANDALAQGAVVEAARRLALWMAYEDIPRVADLKSRPERVARIRREAEAADAQLVEVIDYLKPGAEELAAMLPPYLGRRIMARVAAGKRVPFTGRGLHLRATSVTGHMTLRTLARLKRWRRRSMRFAEEQTAIETWLDALQAALPRDARFAAAVAELPRLLKGYSDTHARGRANYKMLFEGLVLPALRDGTEAATATPLKKAIATALASPEGKAAH